MAKYDLKRNHTRTPEEHRAILEKIDTLQRARSEKGVIRSTSRIKNTGISKSQKRKRNKKNTKPKIYEYERNVDVKGKHSS